MGIAGVWLMGSDEARVRIRRIGVGCIDSWGLEISSRETFIEVDSSEDFTFCREQTLNWTSLTARPGWQWLNLTTGICKPWSWWNRGMPSITWHLTSFPNTPSTKSLKCQKVSSCRFPFMLHPQILVSLVEGDSLQGTTPDTREPKLSQIFEPQFVLPQRCAKAMWCQIWENVLPLADGGMKSTLG